MAKRKISDDQLVKLAHLYVVEAEDFLREKINPERDRNLRYYNGEDPDLGTVEGRSSVTDNMSWEVVQSVLPSLIRIFNSGDKVISIEGQTEEDRDRADTAEAWVNYVEQRCNPGFVNDYTWFQDALIEKTGWEKIFWDVKEESKPVAYDGLTMAELEALKQDENFKPKKIEPGIPQEMVTPAGPKLAATFNVEGYEQDTDATLREMVIPNEEVLYLSDATLNRDSWRFVAHKCRKTLSELRDSGYDVPDDITGPEIDSLDTSDLVLSRMDSADYYRDEDASSQLSEIDPASRKVWFYECYMKVDLNGDGMTEWNQVCFVGSELLGKEEIEEPPMYCITPIIKSHRLTGYSLIDSVHEIHRLSTNLHRQIMDAIYQSINPRSEITEDGITEHTIDDYLDNQVGGYVRVKHAGTVNPLQTSGLPPWVFSIVEHWQSKLEARSGVTRYNQGLDSDSLNKTASGISQIFQAAMQRVELIARVFAETGIRDKIRGLLALSTKYPDYVGEMTVLLGEKQWDITAEAIEGKYDLVINPALGTGNKDQMLMHLQSLMQDYMALAQAGLGPGSEQAMFTIKNLHNAMREKIKNMGYRNYSDFILDPSNQDAERDPVQPPREDPRTALEQQKLQQQAQSDQTDAQLEQQKLKQEYEIKMRELAIKERELTIKEMEIGQNIGIAKLQAEASSQIRPGGGVLTPEELALRERELDIKEREVDAKVRQFERQVAPMQSDGDLQSIAMTLQELAGDLMEMRKPKRFERDEMGLIISVGGRPVTRDETGKIIEIGEAVPATGVGES